MNEAPDKVQMVVAESGLSVPDGYAHEDATLDTAPREPEIPFWPRYYAWVVSRRPHGQRWQIGRPDGYGTLSELKAALAVAIGFHKSQGWRVVVLRAELDSVL